MNVAGGWNIANVSMLRSTLLRSTVRGFIVLSAFLGDVSLAEVPRVLILFSNDRLLPANQEIDEGIREALDPQGNQTSVSLFGEFLDAIRFHGEENRGVMETYLRDRYRNLPPHAVVALGPQALEFLLERRGSLFPGVPLLFGGVSSEGLPQLRNTEGIAGLPMDLTVAPAVEALLGMRPETREILLVHGVSAFDRDWRDEALLQCAPFSDRVRITLCPELPLEELKSRLAGLPPETGVVYLSYFQSPSGETYTPARVATEIAAAAPVPVVGPYDTYIGSGVLAVSATEFREEGLVLGGMIRRVLSGEPVKEIGFLPPNPTRLILDARQMEHWGIRSAPAGAEVRFRTPTLWEEHRTGVMITLAVMALQASLITGLILARLRQKRAEVGLRHSEALFSGVFRGSPAAISILRQSDGRIVDVNPEWETATGVPRGEAIGRTPIEVGMEIGGDAESRFREFLDSGRSLDGYEQVQRTPDGRTRILSLSTELLTLHDEPCFIVLAKDVTELRAAYDARRQLAHASRLAMLGEMTASIAHEINQPLGAILSNTDAAEMLLERPAPPLGEVKAILSDIRRDDRRASEVITRVRALVGGREIRQEVVDLNELLLGTLDMVRHDARRRGVSLVRELAADLPAIRADRVQIEQVVLNFLLNAMDAMDDVPVASRRLVVRSSRREGDSVAASVADTGHGIPPEKLGRIFDSFFTTKEGGMGLGLSLSRSIAESHGGSVFAENNASNGATFHLNLPITSSSHGDAR